MIVRTQRHMTITEAHPFHGMTDAGRRTLDMGGNGVVWEEFSARCPLCRGERRPAKDE